MAGGIGNLSIHDTPITIVDLETTGLYPGADRVVELCVVRKAPSEPAKIVLDTLVNPLRPVAAVEIHGISDEDVVDAPTFGDIADHLQEALSDSVVTSYNVYFDIGFLEYELSQIRRKLLLPYFCLMYARPLLGLGSRVRLSEACKAHGVMARPTHLAGIDAMAASELLDIYLDECQNLDIATFNDLKKRRSSYKFFNSFRRSLPGRPKKSPTEVEFKSRLANQQAGLQQGKSDEPGTAQQLKEYRDALLVAISDLKLDKEEVSELMSLRQSLQNEQVRALHGKVFVAALNPMVKDRWLDDRERKKIRRLYGLLNDLGWAPGT